MRYLAPITLLAPLFLISCANNPGNLSPMIMQQAMQKQTAPLVSENLTCDQLDEQVRATYLAMQPEEVGIVKRALGTAQGVGETVALQSLANKVPGVRFVNGMFRAKSGQKQAVEMFGNQMNNSTKLQALSAARNQKGCQGSTLSLFEDK